MSNCQFELGKEDILFQFQNFEETFSALILGANRGLGLGFVEMLLSSVPSPRVFAGCRRPEERNPLFDLAEKHPSRLFVVPYDASDESTMVQTARILDERNEELQLIINCAGILHGPNHMMPERKLEELDLDAMRLGFAVNAFGPALVAKHFHRFLPRKKRALFINISARVGSIGDNRLGGWHTYRASKAAQNMFTRNIAIELGRKYKQLHVAALHPGTVDTNLSQPFQKNVPEGQLFSVNEAVSRLIKVIDGMNASHHAGFFDSAGKPIPW